MIGPQWTYNSAVPKPLGTKDMGGYTAMVYTPEQLNEAALKTGLVGATLNDLYTIEKNFNAGH